MIKKYMKRPVTLEAVKFEYTEKCINEVKEWMGDKFVESGKERSPNAVGWVKFKRYDSMMGEYTSIVYEGFYITKTFLNDFNYCSPEDFYQTYQEIPDPMIDFSSTYTGC